MPTTFEQIVIRIIKEQELIIGPLALSEAKKVSGLFVDSNNNIKFEGDPKKIIDDLVARYEKLFGRASHEVCKEAVSSIIATLSVEEVPLSLK